MKQKILKKKINKKKVKFLTKNVIIKSPSKKLIFVEKQSKKQKIKNLIDEKIGANVTVPRTLTEKVEENVAFEVKGDGEIEPEVKKKRRGRNKKEKIYFSKKTEEAIIEYNKEQCDKKRNEIYENRIKFSFEKLVENIFNTFKFTYFDNGPLEIQKETVSHLVTNIHKFQEGKGKAFSYFSIVAKNYLIFHNNNNYKRNNQHVDISETPSESTVCLQTEDVYHKGVETQEFMKLLIDYWEQNVHKIFSKSKDLNIAYAVIELFRNCERIENFNKKTLYLYIRELSNCKTQQITKVINKMKGYQREVEESYNNEGVL